MTDIPGRGRRCRAATGIALAVLAAAAPDSGARPRASHGRVIAYMNGFALKTWDAVNGERTIARSASGASPSITSDGRYVAYARNVHAACYRLYRYDAWTRSTVALPGSGVPGCESDERISPDGRFLVFDGQGRAGGDPHDLYLYDVAHRSLVALPATLTSSVEESPSLGRTPEGRYLLAFTSPDGDGWTQVRVADLGTDPATTASAATLLPEPGLPIPAAGIDAQRQPFIAADGSAVAFTTGRDLEERVAIWSRVHGATETPAALRGAGYTAEPALSRSGRYVIVRRKRPGDLVSHLWVFDRGNGSIAPARATWHGSGEDQPAIADPGTILDLTAPVVSLRCSVAAATVRCTLRAGEAARGTLTATRAGRRLGVRALSLPAHRATTVSLALAAPPARPLTVRVDVRDASGNHRVIVRRV